MAPEIAFRVAFERTPNLFFPQAAKQCRGKSLGERFAGAFPLPIRAKQYKRKGL
jgi:hypothetical protein